MTKENIKNFSFYKKIKIYYLNYLNKKISLNIFIDINWTLNDFVVYFSRLYHMPYSKEQSKSVISIFIKNEEYTAKDFKSSKKIFLPQYFDYEKDYVLVLEHKY